MTNDDYRHRCDWGNLGANLYNLEKERGQRRLNQLWQRHAEPQRTAAQQFADELHAAISRTHDCGKPFVSGHYVTVKIPKAGTFNHPEVCINLNPHNERTRHGVVQRPWIQYRGLEPSGRGYRNELPKRFTAASAWASVARHFASLARLQPVILDIAA